MTDHDPTPHHGNNDDWLERAINDAVPPSAKELAERFAQFDDKNDSYYKRLATKQEEVLGLLASEIPSAERLIIDLQKKRLDDPTTDFNDLMKSVNQQLQDIEKNEGGEPRATDLAHLDEILLAVNNIAYRSFDDIDKPVRYWATKAGIQAAIAESDKLAPADKQALSELAEHFLQNDISYDPSDPLQVMEAVTELGREEAEKSQELYEKAGQVTDSIVGYPLGIDITSEAYFDFKKAMQEAVISDKPELVDIIEKFGERFGVPMDEFYEAVDTAVRLARDPDWDDDYDWGDDTVDE